jgi:predicted TIM-barrel fold metal-dependent hydrolase
MFPLITLEEHYISPRVRQGWKDAAIDPYSAFPEHLVTKLESLGDQRTKDMNKGDVSIQVLSHATIDASPLLCSQANDDLAVAISKNPTRLAGFATLSMCNPNAAASELARCVKEYGFVGALIDNHLDGQFYDASSFWPVFDKAHELDVPIYIHPTFASEGMMEHYKGNYDDQVASALSAFGWGWHVETGMHILRLFASGLFDRLPQLKIIIGHMGELLPFQLDRIVGIFQGWGKMNRGLREVWKNNIWITTSGMFSLPPLACLLQTTTIEHVLYSVDYPFSSNEKGSQFIEEIRKSGLLEGNELEKFAFRNAENLLKLKATSP